MRKGFVLISPLMGIAVFLLVLSTVNLLSSEDARLNLMLQDTLKFREVAFHANRVTLDVFNASDWMFEEKLGQLMTSNHGYYSHGTEENSYGAVGGIRSSILSELESNAINEFSSTIADAQINVYSDSKYNVFINEWDESQENFYVNVESIDNFAEGENGSFVVRMYSADVNSEPLVVLEDSSLSTSGFKSRVEAKALQKQSFHPRVRVFKYAWIVEDILKRKFNSDISNIIGVGVNLSSAEGDLENKIETYFDSLSDLTNPNYFIVEDISIESVGFSEGDLSSKSVSSASETNSKAKAV
ncbi:MAG: hypothetical protein KAS30_00780, partial [Candidatus Diapherotrites archaeon]|nr:hypothetical protein [Candidatus Diapherotrites archaeon]